MGLNGWQRLWVVLAVMWLLPVMVFSYELWPTTANVSKDEVYAQLRPDDGNRLINYIATSQSGGGVVIPDIDFSKYTSQADANASGTLPPLPPEYVLDQPRATGEKRKGQPLTVVRSEPLPGPILNIDGHEVQFNEGVLPEDVNQTTKAYTGILRHILSVKRATFIGKTFAFWMAPAITLYLVGWAIAWVRRGFRQVA